MNNEWMVIVSIQKHIYIDNTLFSYKTIYLRNSQRLSWHGLRRMNYLYINILTRRLKTVHQKPGSTIGQGIFLDTAALRKLW